MSKSALKRSGHVDRQPVPAAQRTKHPGGRPTLYNPQMVTDACFLARQGATDIEIAEALGISIARFYVFSGQYPEFREAVQSAKEVADDRMEHSLYRRGIGYEINTQKLHQGNVVSIREHVHADPGAAMNWLANRRRATWRKNTDVSLVIPEPPALPEAEQTERSLALAALALFAATQDPEPDGPLLELHSNIEETEDDGAQEPNRGRLHVSGAEQDQGRVRRSRRDAVEPFDPDFDL